jgi:outer membrane protein
MKKIIQSLAALAAFGALALAAQAQPAPKIYVVDMAKLYDTHYKTQEQNAKIQADDQKAQEEVEKMNKEGNALVEEYKSLNDQASNPTLSADAKSKAQDAAQKKLEQIQGKQREVQTFIQNTRNSLGQRLNTFRSLMLEEITKVATDVAKRKGATLLIDKAGPTAIGISNFLYTDPAYDITEDVLKEINKDRPANVPAPAPAAAAPAATPSTSTPAPAPSSSGSSGSTPAVSIPGIKK